MKFCVNCRYSKLVKYRSLGKETCDFVCNSPQNISSKVDMVTGESKSQHKWHSCYNLRKPYPLQGLLYKICGEEGKWFEARVG